METRYANLSCFFILESYRPLWHRLTNLQSRHAGFTILLFVSSNRSKMATDPTAATCLATRDDDSIYVVYPAQLLDIQNVFITPNRDFIQEKVVEGDEVKLDILDRPRFATRVRILEPDTLQII